MSKTVYTSLTDDILSIVLPPVLTSTLCTQLLTGISDDGPTFHGNRSTSRWLPQSRCLTGSIAKGNECFSLRTAANEPVDTSDDQESGGRNLLTDGVDPNVFMGRRGKYTPKRTIK